MILRGDQIYLAILIAYHVLMIARTDLARMVFRNSYLMQVTAEIRMLLMLATQAKFPVTETPNV